MRSRFRAASVFVAAGAVVAAGLAVAGPAAAGPYRYLTQPAVPAGSDARTIAIDSGAQRAYVSDFATDSVSVLNTATNALVATVDVGDGPDAVAVNPANHKVYVANIGPDKTGNTVTVIDGTTNTVAATATVGIFPSAIEVDRLTGKAYVTNYYSGSVSVVDDATNAVVSSIAVSPQPSALAVDPGIQRVYVLSDTGRGMLSVINSNTGVVIKSAETYSGYIAVDPGVHNFYVVDYFNGLTIYNSDGTVKANVDVKIDCLCKDEFREYGTHATSVTIDPTTRTLFIGGGYGRPYPSVQVVDLVTRTVTDKPRISADVVDVAVDTTTHTPYALTKANGVVPIRRLSTRIQQEAPVAATVQQGQSYSGQLVSSNTVGAVTYSTTSEPGPLTVSSSGFVSAPATLAAGVYTASGKSRDARGGYGSWTFSLTVSEPTQARADLSVSLAAPANAASASNVTVTVTVKNNGPNDADQPETVVSIPDGWATSGSTQGGVKDGQSLTFRSPSLPNQSSATYTFDLIPGTAGPATIYATTGSETRDPKFSDNVSRKTVQVS